jgi:ubiquinone/menaquinone biosynthesis C-methylase UbiE
MGQTENEQAREFYAQTYDTSVPDWPGELDFYRRIAAGLKRHGMSLLEVACGTGRVAIRLAQEGTQVVGLDLSAKMLAEARQKSQRMDNIRWVEADMRLFELGEKFGLAIIPGHAFQNLNTPKDQVACLECIMRHLEPGGKLVIHLDHQDLSWLGGLVGEKSGIFEPAEQFKHPQTGRTVCAYRAWTYEPSTQTAICQTAWEEIDENGQVVERWQTDPTRLHCVFRFEMEHLLGRVGYTVEALYGDFFRNPLGDNSSEMIWVAQVKNN